MINYIIQLLLFQTLFLAVYDLFLQKETFFKWNRIYLLATPILSFIIPLLKLESFRKSVPQDYMVYLPEVVINPQVYIENSTPFEASLGISTFIFYVGMGLFFILFLVRLTKILKLIFTNKSIKKDKYTLIVLDEKQAAFSFFNYIFINSHLLENQNLQIIQHELIHCKQKHTLDLLYFELLKIVLWFNPLVYVYQKRITLLHEYISDAEVIKETDKKTYFNKLLAETFNVENISFINQFFKHSLIKKRIIMITKEKSQKMKQLKYLLIAPLLLGMLVYSSCTDELNDELLEMETVLSQSNDYSQGKYFDFEAGKTYVGNSILIGRYLDINEYTSKEKELHNKFNNLDGSFFDYIVILDENNERVNWLRPKSKIESNKVAWEYVESEPVPFALIENVPVFPDCEGTEEELRQCLQEKITEHINTNFNVKMANSLGLQSGMKKIFVMFKIDKEGNIVDVQARGPHQSLADEATRVINLLPKMIPGKQKGGPVGVKYTVPIAFKVE